ncbi:hypothetical protein PG988_002838 [Apiospora saccharicola]
MAGTSPTRRSSRARTTQPQSQHSSSASSASGRAERTTRAFTKNGSPQKSTGSGSLSSEPPEESTATTASTDDIAPLLRRRSTRVKDEDREKQPKGEHLDMANTSDDNEIQEDDEAVRCVCGFEDYPGPPPLDEDTKSHALKDSIDLEPIFSIDITEDLGGFFVQCDTCKVWEHGLCSKVLHIPSHPPTFTKYFSSRIGCHPWHAVAQKQRAQSSRASASAAAAAAAASHKRRSTMNSRDAAYDEEEQLRRAIEASKEDAIPEELEGLGRRPKRGRDDEEDRQSESIIKRQRTNSKSPSPSADQAPMESREESEDESGSRIGVSKKSSRNNVRNQREKTEREERREEQERKRVEAANKRKGRAERRRADGMTAATTITAKLHNADVGVDLDSDPSDEMPSSTRAVVSRTTESVQPPDPPVSSQPAPDTPPANPPPSASHKKKAAPQPRKKGRNQYTKDRDANEHEDSPARSMSRDITRNQDDHHVAHTKPSISEPHNKHSNSKAKGGMSSKITMSDLKRRANGILEFISRTQVELANEPLSEKNSPHQRATDDGTAADMPPIHVNGTQVSYEKGCGDLAVTKLTTSAVPSKDFKDMTCVEMMDSLTRDLVKWQKEFAS